MVPVPFHKSPALYGGAIALCQALVAVLSVASYTRQVATNYALLVSLFAITIVAFIVGVLLAGSLVYRMWGRIQDEEITRIAPGLAVGLLFVPFVNLVWLFVAFPGFAQRYNQYRLRHDFVAAPRLSVALQVLFVVFVLLPVPIVQWAVTYAAVRRLVEATNALPAEARASAHS